MLNLQKTQPQNFFKSSSNIICFSPSADSPPLKKGNSQMDSSVQDNPAAPTPFQLTLIVLSNSVLGKYSNTHFTQPFLNRLVSSRACPLSLQYQAAFSQARLKSSCWALPPWGQLTFWHRQRIIWFIEDEGSFPSLIIQLLHHPLPHSPVSKLNRRHKGWLRIERQLADGEGVGEEPNHATGSVVEP